MVSWDKGERYWWIYWGKLLVLILCNKRDISFSFLLKKFYLIGRQFVRINQFHNLLLFFKKQVVRYFFGQAKNTKSSCNSTLSTTLKRNFYLFSYVLVNYCLYKLHIVSTPNLSRIKALSLSLSFSQKKKSKKYVLPVEIVYNKESK